MCSNQQCCDGMMHSDLVNPAAECIHLKAATCATMAKEIWLTEDALQELHSLQNISKSTQERCIEEQINAWKSSASVVALADFTPYGYNDRMLYFSVFTGSVSYYAKFMRVRVTFDSVTGDWSCKCPASTEKKSCIHEVLAKWYLMQESPSQLELGQRYTLCFFENCSIALQNVCNFVSFFMLY